MAEFLRSHAGLESRLDARGKVGELTIWVGDVQVIRKGFFKFPDKADVLAAIQQEL